MTSNTEPLNIDHAEVNKFEQLASRWWDPQGEFKPLHDINPLRLNYIDDRAPLANQHVVDIGCGGGILSESMAARGAKVLGIDAGRGPINVARLHALESGVELDYQQITAEQLAAERPEAFDIVTCMELLEHVPDPASLIRACAQLVKPGGHVFFSTINRTPQAYALAVIGAEYIMRLLPKGTHDYRKFIRPAELDRWVRAADLHTEDLSGMSYNPLTRTFSLGRNIQINYLCHTRRNPV